MSSIRAIVADDERQVRDELVRMLVKHWPELDIVAVADNGEQAANLLQGLTPDVAFLDIKMPMQSGIDAAALAGDGCHVVFVTAYEDYAVKAFEQAASDYILKPVQEQRLLQTIERLKVSLSAGAVGSKTGWDAGENTLRGHHAANKDKLRWLRVSHGDTVVILSTDDVIYFRAGDKYTTVMTAEKSYLIRKPLSELEQELEQTDFWRIHRSVIVNVSQIQNVRKGLNGSRIITLKGSKEALTSSRSYRHLFEQM